MGQHSYTASEHEFTGPAPPLDLVPSAKIGRAPPGRVVAIALIGAVAVLAGCGVGEGDGSSATLSTDAEVVTAPASTLDGPAVDDVEATIADLVAEQGQDGAPGCAVSVVADGALVFEGGYGAADLATGVRIDAGTTFDIASVSKQFTATAVYLLAEEGELSLDDDIHEFVPELPDYGAPVTLDDLVHHTSGLTDYTELLADEFDDTDVTTTEQALDAVVDIDELSFEPGSTFEYNNSNYFLLALVVEDVTGLTLGQFLEEEVFDPLGMDQTVVRDDAALDVAGSAEGYAADGQGGFEPNTTNWEQVGDGAVWTSVRDLQRWAANLSNFEVGGSALERDLLAPGGLPDEEGNDYAGGLTLLPGGQLEHSGSWAGFLSELIVEPETQTSVAVLCNRDDAYPYDLADQVLALF